MGLGEILKETPFGHEGITLILLGWMRQRYGNISKNQQMNESIMDEYDSDLDKDPFKGAGIKEENDK